MKFSCYKNDLNEALQFVIRAVAVKPQTPVIAGIYLKAEGSMLEIQANNFSTGIITRIPVNTEVPGETVVSGKRFQEFVRNMPDDTITFSDMDSSQTLVIKSGSANVELLTMAVVDFPKVKTPETENSFKILSTKLQDLIRKTVFAASKDDSRPIFTGCFLEIKGDKISLVATNTHRFALATAQLLNTYSDAGFIVPAESLRGIMARIDPRDVDNYIQVNYSDRYVTFSFDNVFVTSRLIEGQFPPYENVIPASSNTQVEVDYAEFKKAVEFVSLMSKETEYNTVKFVIRNDNIEVSSNSPDIGGAIKDVEARIDGDGLEISFNADYITDVLRVFESTRINIDLNDQYSPAKFTEPGNEHYVYIATPVRA